ncbi:MAG: phosphohydrolase [Alphaproteobacteria bacterium]|jgi:hypothetical protein
MSTIELDGHAVPTQDLIDAYGRGEKGRQEMRHGDWIQTYTGLAMYPLDPRPEEVDLVDIARALSNLCRFTGHTRKFYSVAEHSVHCSRIVPPEHALWALLHDASEAYISDVSRPLKNQDAFGAYREAETRLQAAICAKFGLPNVQPEEVKKADAIMLAIEAADLMAPLRPDWQRWLVDIGSVDISVATPWSPERAFSSFMERAIELGLVP